MEINKFMDKTLGKTYRQKMEELRILSLQIVEKGLRHEDPSMAFANANLFLTYNRDKDDLDKEMPAEPDALDAEELIETKKEEAK